MKHEFMCEKEWKEWRKSLQICERENTKTNTTQQQDGEDECVDKMTPLKRREKEKTQKRENNAVN